MRRHADQERIDACIALGGENYVFWGGREGYMSLLNTNMKREKDHLAMMLTMARDYGRKNGFKGTFLIEPKPMEPTKHQYDVDSETVIGFLRHYGLDKDFALNIEVNHATLPDIHSSMSCKPPPTPACCAVLTRTVAITRMVGIRINSRWISMSWHRLGWSSLREVA